VSRLWSLLFLAVPVVGVWICIWSANNGYWLPDDISSHGHTIDHLFNFCLWLTGAVFVVTELVMVWFMWKYDAKAHAEPVKYMHGSHNLEIVWTIIPAATLLFIAIYQMNAWANVKMRVPEHPDVEVEVVARQFEWRIRYPGKDGVFNTRDDLHSVNDLHVPVGKQILVRLKSQDVLHDFFLPHLRIKQDAVPGMVIPVWFKAERISNVTGATSAKYDLVCAELCGWGHYKMKGQLTVETREEYERFLANLEQQQEATQ